MQTNVLKTSLYLSCPRNPEPQPLGTNRLHEPKTVHVYTLLVRVQTRTYPMSLNLGSFKRDDEPKLTPFNPTHHGVFKPCPVTGGDVSSHLFFLKWKFEQVNLKINHISIHNTSFHANLWVIWIICWPDVSLCRICDFLKIGIFIFKTICIVQLDGLKIMKETFFRPVLLPQNVFQDNIKSQKSLSAQPLRKLILNNRGGVLPPSVMSRINPYERVNHQSERPLCR